MYVKCSHCKARHRVTDENVRADGSSIKCRNCDTLIYFMNPPPIRVESRKIRKTLSRHTEQAKTKQKKEYSKPVSVPVNPVLKEEKREQKEPVSFSVKGYRGNEHTTRKVSSPEVAKTDAPSTVQSVFDNIALKLEKLSEEKSDTDYNPFKNINIGDKSTRRIIVFILVGIFLLGLFRFILSKI